MALQRRPRARRHRAGHRADGGHGTRHRRPLPPRPPRRRLHGHWLVPATVPGPPSGWSTVFSDDFNGGSGSGIDSQWFYNTGPGSNFGTGEIETMTNSTANVHLDGNGNVDLTAIGGGSSWTSGRVETNATVGAPAGGGELEVTASIEQPSGGLGYWPDTVLDAGPGAVAGTRRDRHHGGRQLAVRAIRDRALRRRPRADRATSRTASAVDSGGARAASPATTPTR